MDLVPNSKHDPETRRTPVSALLAACQPGAERKTTAIVQIDTDPAASLPQPEGGGPSLADVLRAEEIQEPAPHLIDAPGQYPSF